MSVAGANFSWLTCAQYVPFPFSCDCMYRFYQYLGCHRNSYPIHHWFKSLRDGVMLWIKSEKCSFQVTNIERILSLLFGIKRRICYWHRHVALVWDGFDRKWRQRLLYNQQMLSVCSIAWEYTIFRCALVYSWSMCCSFIQSQNIYALASRVYHCLLKMVYSYILV